MNRLVFPVAALLLLVIARSAPHADESSPASPDVCAPYTAEQMSRAVTAAINSRPAGMMRATAASAGQEGSCIAEYTRPSDGSLWRLQVVPDDRSGTRWSSRDRLTTLQRPGRWGTHTLDEVLRWYVNGTGVLVISGEAIEKHPYGKADIQPALQSSFPMSNRDRIPDYVERCDDSVLIGLDGLTAADLQVRTDHLQRVLPQHGPSSGTWRQRIFAGCGAFDLRTWTLHLPEFSVSRILQTGVFNVHYTSGWRRTIMADGAKPRVQGRQVLLFFAERWKVRP